MEVKEEGDIDVWYIKVTTDMLTAGREEFRKALAEIVKEAIARGWMDAGKAERWFEKLEKGRMLKEGCRGTTWGCSVAVRLRSDSVPHTNPDSTQQETQRLRDMGLVEGIHFSVKMPEGGGWGYVSV